MWLILLPLTDFSQLVLCTGSSGLIYGEATDVPRRRTETGGHDEQIDPQDPVFRAEDTPVRQGRRLIED